MSIYTTIYTLGIYFYYGLTRFATIFHPKAKLWYSERKKYPIEITPARQELSRYWFHCASLGEFDQALPLIRRLENMEKVEIIVSFYSPSGFQQVIGKEKFRNIQFFYLPADYKYKMKALIKRLEPTVILIVKYELWHHFINEAFRKKIPLILFSAYFHQEQSYFKAITKTFYRDIFNKFSTIYLLNKTSKELLEQNGVKTKILVNGDTRVEQCLDNTNEEYLNPLLEKFCKKEKTIIAGSSWQREEKLITDIHQELHNTQWLIVPHDVSKKHIRQIQKQFGVEAICLSNLNETNITKTKIVIVDGIGHLKYLYRWAWLSFIGGGYSGALHNILEPIAYLVPVICGPKTKRFPEADILQREKVLVFSEENKESLIQAIRYFEIEKHYKNAQNNAKRYISCNTDAAEVILSGLLK